MRAGSQIGKGGHTAEAKTGHKPMTDRLKDKLAGTVTLTGDIQISLTTGTEPFTYACKTAMRVAASLHKMGKAMLHERSSVAIPGFNIPE